MWGAILRGLSFLPTIGKGAVNFAKKHPIPTIIGGGTVGTTLLSGKNKNEQPQEQEQSSQQEQPTQQKQQEQTQSSSKPKSKSKGSSSSGETINLPPLKDVIKQLVGIPSSQGEAEQQDNNSTEELSLPKIANQIQGLFVDLDKHRQMYEVLSQQYLQANDIYEKQLLQTMQAIPFLIAKTPLNNMTTEDLNEHLNNLFTSMPYTDALEKVNQLTKGYYIAKMNGVDPKTLSTTDLVMIADNPALAKSVNDNIVQFLEQTGEILKYKIKSNMDKVGALKDQYQNVLKELEEKGKLYKEIIDAYKAEMKQKFDEYKFDTKLDAELKMHADKMAEKYEELKWKEYYQGKKLGLAEENQKLKEEKTKNGEEKGGIKEKLDKDIKKAEGQ